MDFIISYLTKMSEPHEQEQGTQFTDLPSEVLKKIAEYQEEDIALAGAGVRQLGVYLGNALNPNSNINQFLRRSLGEYAVRDEQDRIRKEYAEWQDILGNAIYVNNWIRGMGGMERINPAQLLRIQRRFIR